MKTDRTVKGLLGAIAVLLFLLLVRPAAVTTPAQAQFQGPSTGSTPALVVDNNLVYVLDRGQLSVFYVDFGVKDPFEILRMMGDEKEQEKLFKSTRLRLLLRQDIHNVPAVGKPAS